MVMPRSVTYQPLPKDADPWWEQGECCKADAEQWFPGKGESPRDAKRICGRCPVKAECLEYALANDERHGVWGGLSERERRAVAARRRLKPPDKHYNRTKTHCDNDHPLVGENLRIDSKTGQRVCKACVAFRVREHRARRVS